MKINLDTDDILTYQCLLQRGIAPEHLEQAQLAVATLTEEVEKPVINPTSGWDNEF